MDLNHKLRAIGFRVSVSSVDHSRVQAGVDIERTLLEGIRQFPKDSRLASLVLSWIKVHGRHVIVEKLSKLAAQQLDEKQEIAPWLSMVAAFAAKYCGHRWKKLVAKRSQKAYLYPKDVTESAVALKGSIPWLNKIGILVPEGSLRIREDDVLSPGELSRMNRQYRNRYLYGACWRADIITAIEEGISRPVDICHRMGCSYEPAHRIAREYRLATSR